MLSTVPVISGKKLTAKNKRLQIALEHHLNRWMQEQANAVGEVLKANYRKGMWVQTKATRKALDDAGGEDLQTELLVGGKKIPKIQSDLIRALALLGWGAVRWEPLIGFFRSFLNDAGDEGVSHGLGDLALVNASQVKDKAEEDAEAYADRRSAELGGMKRNADGTLEEDPEARWPLTDVMQRDIENSIAMAVTEGWTAEQLAAVIDASYAVSAERATIVANTEITNAQSDGTYSLWRQSGVVTLVAWRTSDSHDQDDECDDYEAQGVVPLGHEFAPGIFSPRAHPFCLCELEVVDPNDSLEPS